MEHQNEHRMEVRRSRGVSRLKAEATQLLKDADQRQPFPRRLVRVGRQELLKLPRPRPDPRHRLALAPIAEVRLVRPQDLPDGIPRHVQFPHDLLHRPLLDTVGPSDPRDRIHSLHTSLRLLTNNERSDKTSGGVRLDADTPP